MVIYPWKMVIFSSFSPVKQRPLRPPSPGWSLVTSTKGKDGWHLPVGWWPPHRNPRGGVFALGIHHPWHHGILLRCDFHGRDVVLVERVHGGLMRCALMMRKPCGHAGVKNGTTSRDMWKIIDMYLKIRTLLENGIPQNAGSRFSSTAPTKSQQQSQGFSDVQGWSGWSFVGLGGNGMVSHWWPFRSFHVSFHQELHLETHQKSWMARFSRSQKPSSVFWATPMIIWLNPHIKPCYKKCEKHAINGLKKPGGLHDLIAGNPWLSQRKAIRKTMHQMLGVSIWRNKSWLIRNSRTPILGHHFFRIHGGYTSTELCKSNPVPSRCSECLWAKRSLKIKSRSLSWKTR